MSERILNGDFSDELVYWINGADGGLPFEYLEDEKRIHGDSEPDGISEKTYKIKQQFSVNNEVISGLISTWGMWQSSGGGVNGYNRFIIDLIKPSTSVINLLDTTKIASSGDGKLLDNLDIKSHFNEYGNYELRLTLKTKSKRDSEDVFITEPYTNWTNGGDLFSLYESDNKIKKVSDDISGDQYVATMIKQFTINAPASSALLTVQAKGSKEHEDATAIARVKIRKIGYAWNTLFNDELTGDTWQNIINNEDISNHLTSPGTYELKLEAQVKSYEWPEPLTYYTGEIHFANVDFTINWYEYTKSHGWYDDVSVNIAIKKYKTVIESFGSGEFYHLGQKTTKKEDFELSESYSSKVGFFRSAFEIINFFESVFKKVKKTTSEAIEFTESHLFKFLRTKKEDIEFDESYSTQRTAFKTVSESIEFSPSISKKIKKTVFEALEFVERYFPKADFLKTIKENIELVESYSTQKTCFNTVSESIKLIESLAAKVTAGNVEKTYVIEPATEWEETAKKSTQWIKKKIEIR